MSTTTNDKPVQSVAAAFTGSNNPQPDAFTVSAFDYIAGMRGTLERVQRTEQSIYQTVIALFFALAARNSLLPPVTIDRGKNKETIADAEITETALVAVDGSADERKARGVAKLHDALCALMAKALGVQMEKTARDIVQLAARMHRHGYRVADWNGSIREVDGKMVPFIGEPVEGAPAYDFPGVFKVKAIHIGGHSDAKLVVAGKRPKPGSTDGEMEDVFVDAEQQIVPLYDHWINIAIGKDAPVRKRVGRQSLMEGTKTYAEHIRGLEISAKDKADKDKADKEKQVQREATAEHQANADSTANPEDVASRKDSNDQPPPPAPGSATGDAAKGGDGKNGTTTASPQNKASDGQADVSTGNTNAAGEHDRRVNEDQTRADREKLVKAMTPVELPDWVKQTFIVDRIKGDPALRLSLLQTYSHLYGILGALNLTEFRGNPTPQTFKAAKEMSLTKPVTKAASPAKKQ